MGLPEGIEVHFHNYEHFYEDCFVKRQYDADLAACPAVDCANQVPMTEAIATLDSSRCSASCLGTACGEAIKIVLTYHDLCTETVLPDSLEKALHAYEDPCAEQLCNTAPAAFDVYADPCSAEASAASGFKNQIAFLVTTLALSVAVFICHSHAK